MKLLNMLITALDEIDGTTSEYKAAVYGNGRLGAISPAEQYNQRTQFKMPTFVKTAKKIIGAPIRRIQERLRQRPRGGYPSLPVTTLPRSRR